MQAIYCAMLLKLIHNKFSQTLKPVSIPIQYMQVFPLVYNFPLMRIKFDANDIV